MLKLTLKSILKPINKKCFVVLYCGIASKPAMAREEKHPYDLYLLSESPAVEPVLTREEALIYYRYVFTELGSYKFLKVIIDRSIFKTAH